MLKKLDETELSALALNFLENLNIDDLDEYVVTNVDTTFNNIVASKKNVVENVTKQDWLSVMFDLNENKSKVVHRKEIINCETHDNTCTDTIISMSVNNNKFLKGYKSETYKNDELTTTNTYSDLYEVEEGYSITDGYPQTLTKGNVR